MAIVLHLGHCKPHHERMTAFLFSCENATCAVPEAYREIFRGSEDALTSTEGWEPGSLNLAQAFSMRFRTPLVHGDVTRLLIDLEQDGDARWSRFSTKLPEAVRGKVADRHQKPYRTQLDQRIAEDLRRHKAVLHVMVHTSPDTHGHIELETPANADLAEKIATSWKSQLQRASDLDVRHHRNGTNQAHAAALAEIHPPDQYAQIRLTVAQSFFLEGKPWRWETLKKLLLDTLNPAVSEVTRLSGPESPSTAQP